MLLTLCRVNKNHSNLVKNADKTRDPGWSRRVTRPPYWQNPLSSLQGISHRPAVQQTMQIDRGKRITGTNRVDNLVSRLWRHPLDASISATDKSTGTATGDNKLLQTIALDKFLRGNFSSSQYCHQVTAALLHSA